MHCHILLKNSYQIKQANYSSIKARGFMWVRQNDKTTKDAIRIVVVGATKNV